MIKAIIFDCFGVLYEEQRDYGEVRMVRNQALLDYAEGLRKTYKLGLLSNLSPGGMNTYFTQAERERYFDTVVISGEVGVSKPEPAIYELTAERLGVEPAEAVFIDDLAVNCDGAREAGMQTIVYVNMNQLQTDLAKVLPHA